MVAADRTNNSRMLRMGFVPLLDAAPLIAALELGYFADEGLAVSLHRQIGWGNVRDKLTFGQLDASHALAGMPLASQLGWQWFAEPLVSLMTLATGGDGITLSKRLADRGVRSAELLAQWIGERTADQPKLRLAHVFGCSVHHYLLRQWLESGGIDPERDVTLSVVPPPQMGRQMAEGGLDGFCAGEPWNTLAERDGAGVIVLATADLLPDHPEKILAVSRRWLGENGDVAEGMIRAAIRGCGYCHEAGNHGALAKMLSSPKYLDMPVKVLEESLAFTGARDSGGRTQRPRGWHARSFDPGNTFPSATHMAWLLDRMVRAGHAPGEIDPLAMARRCCEAGPYRRAARSLEIDCPSNDFPPMPLRAGTYDPLTTHRRLMPTP